MRWLALLSLLAGCASTPKEPAKLMRQTSACSEPTMVSPAKLAYFKKLLANPNSDLDEFLVTWSDRKAEIAGDPFFYKCEPLAGKSLVPDPKTMNLPAECAPDVLYAWGSFEKLAELTRALRSGTSWSDTPLPGSETISASLSPSTSFTSGVYQIRVKLKKGTRIYAPFTEKQAAAGGLHPVVYTGNNDQRLSLGDFVIYDANAILGWSYGTPEQYDEIVREIRWIKSGKRTLGYLQNDPYATVGWPRFFALTVVQFNEPTDAALKNNLMELLKMIVKGAGEIAFNGDNCPSRAEFFRASKPTYVAP